MHIVSGYDNIKLGEMFFPENDLPYILVTIFPSQEIIEAGSVVWNITEKEWEIASREEAKEMVKKMGRVNG